MQKIEGSGVPRISAWRGPRRLEGWGWGHPSPTGEGVCPSPMEEGSGEGAVPSPVFLVFLVENTVF